MLNNEPLTLEQLVKASEQFKQRETVYVNKKTYEAILQKLDFVPSNLEVNNFLVDNQAIVLNETQKENMNKGFFPIRDVW